MLRSRNMGLRLGATTKTWELDEYTKNGNIWKPGRSTTVTGSEVKKEPKNSRRGAKDSKHGHLVTPSGSGIKEKFKTRHVSQEKRQCSPHSQPQTNEEERQVETIVTSVKPWYNFRSIMGFLFCILFFLVCFGAIPWDILSQGGSASKAHSSLRSVLQSRDLVAAKSYSDTACRALDRLPSGLALDNDNNEKLFNESRSTVFNITSKFSRDTLQVDLLDTFLGRELSPSIKANVSIGNCSLIVSARPIVQTT